MKNIVKFYYDFRHSTRANSNESRKTKKPRIAIYHTGYVRILENICTELPGLKYLVKI